MVVAVVVVVVTAIAVAPQGFTEAMAAAGAKVKETVSGIVPLAVTVAAITVVINAGQIAMPVLPASASDCTRRRKRVMMTSSS